MTQPTRKFSSTRAFFWPIQGSEVKKFLPMGLMMFFMIFNYTILRNTKDALIMTSSGAEALPFLKGGIVLPFSILFVTLYAKMSNILNREKLFYFVIGVFLGFFVLFNFYLYPYRAYLHPSAATIDSLKQAYPYFQHIFALAQHWVFSLFYTFAELWGIVMINLLFWQFANEITRTQEAKRFYSMFGFIGHFALVVAGYTVNYCCEQCGLELLEEDTCGRYLNLIVTAALIGGMIIMVIYRWIYTVVLTDQQYYDKAIEVKNKKREDRPKLSLWESFHYIAGSKYLGLIFILVFGYGFSMSLLGLLWKKQIALQFPNPIDYSHFMGNFSIATGCITVLLIFFLKGIVEKFGWLKGAIVTPLILLVTALIFFCFTFYKDSLAMLMGIFHTTPLYLAVMVGTSQQLFSRSSKYSLFDPTKEMAYIPLDQELKIKGKAAVDVTGYTFSKACGGYFSGALLVLTAASDLMVIAPYLALVVLLTIGVWLYTVGILNKEYQQALAISPLTSPPPATSSSKSLT